MLKMESAISKTIRSSTIDVNIKIRITDFRTASEPSSNSTLDHSDRDFHVWFSASASPNGFDVNTEGWLVVRPYVTVLRGKYRPQDSMVSWTVSVIDSEGNSRFPVSFTQDLGKDIKYAKYLERPFILSRADDLLLEGVLTLSIDICFQWYDFAPLLAAENQSRITETFIPDEPSCERELVEYDPEADRELVEYDPEAGPSDDLAGFLEKNKILAEVLYIAELGKVCATYDLPSLADRHPKVWTFDTRDQSINVILYDRPHSIGSRLLKASSVIRGCVNAPMKEQREKRIKLPDVDSMTFKCVAYFLTKETLPKFEFDEILKIYKFSHMYDVKDLQRNCAENMMISLEDESDFIEVQKLADFYSDEYLSELLCSRRHGHENLSRDLQHLRMDDRPCSDSFV